MKAILRFEKYFFLLLIFLHLLPVAMLGYFVTHDGPSHVYNSYIIANLLNGDALTAQYFMFNPQPVPNWLGHFLLVLFNLFFAGNISEKLLLCLYIIALPYSFRYFLFTLNRDSRWATWMIFPFIYSLYVYQGLYNFCLAMPLLFYTLSYFIRGAETFSAKRIFVLALLAMLLYFSHIFMLLLFIFLSFVYLFSGFLSGRKEAGKENGFRLFLHQAGALLVALLPSLFLSALFVLSNSGEGEEYSEPSIGLRFEFLALCRPLITLDFDEEQFYAGIVAMLFWLILFFAAGSRLRNLKIVRQDVWFIAVLLMLVIYFAAPDTIATGSFVSLRLLAFIYLFSIAWLGTNETARAVKNFSMSVFPLLSLCFLGYHLAGSKTAEEEAKEYVSVAAHIPGNSVVLPVSYSSNWLHSNLSNYLGAEKNLILLDNYEAAMTHFPTTWKPAYNPYVEMNIRYLETPCLDIDRYEKVTGRKIDYIIRWGFNDTFRDSCAIAISNYLKENYSPVFVSENNKAEVFRRNR
ncbi:MAG TPA: hypothetical protein VI757_00105 [Bacteroidia bacterium]|nr:hypothetical protein [Bacteroidia bacterium]